jgi:hypothetical protein
MFMHNVLQGFFFQNTDFLLKRNGNMQLQQMLVKENIIFTKDRKNILGQEIILVPEKDKVKEIS